MSGGDGRRLVLIQQSARPYCQVCDTAGVLRAVALSGIPASFPTPCLHCDPVGSGVDAIPVLPLPMRDDTKRTAS